MLEDQALVEAGPGAGSVWVRQKHAAMGRGIAAGYAGKLTLAPPFVVTDSRPALAAGNGGPGDHGGGSEDGKDDKAATAKDGGGLPPAGAPGSLRSQRLSNSMMHMQHHMHPITEETPHMWQVRWGPTSPSAPCCAADAVCGCALPPAPVALTRTTAVVL